MMIISTPSLRVHCKAFALLLRVSSDGLCGVQGSVLPLNLES